MSGRDLVDEIEDALQAPAVECRAWRQAYKLAEANPRVPVTVWRSRGEYLVLKKGQLPPARARSLGTIEAPFNDPVHFIEYRNGRAIVRTIPAKGST